jgi:hypothetical protein
VGAVAGLVPDVELQPNADRAVVGGYMIVQHDFSPTTRGRFDAEPLLTVASKNKDTGALEISTAMEVESQKRVFLAGRAKIIRDLRPESAASPFYIGGASADLWFAVSQDLRLGAGYRLQDRRAEDLSLKLTDTAPGAPAGIAPSPQYRGTDSQLDAQLEFRPARLVSSSAMAGLSKLEGVPQDGLFAREELTFGPFGASTTRFGVAYLYQSSAFDYHQPELFVSSSPIDRLRLVARYAVLADATFNRRIYGHSVYALGEARLSQIWAIGLTARVITGLDNPDSLHAFAYAGREF